MLHEPSATEVWSTGGERMGVRDGALTVVAEGTRWHASSSSRTPIGGEAAGCANEVDALVHVRSKLVAAMAAIDARLSDLAGQPSQP